MWPFRVDGEWECYVLQRNIPIFWFSCVNITIGLIFLGYHYIFGYLSNHLLDRVAFEFGGGQVLYWGFVIGLVTVCVGIITLCLSFDCCDICNFRRMNDDWLSTRLAAAFNVIIIVTALFGMAVVVDYPTIFQMKLSLKNHENGGIWDYFQSEMKCCGITQHDEWYDHPLWPQRKFVPDSCCREIFKGCGETLKGTDLHEGNCYEAYVNVFSYARGFQVIIPLFCGFILMEEVFIIWNIISYHKADSAIPRPQSRISAANSVFNPEQLNQDYSTPLKPLSARVHASPNKPPLRTSISNTEMRSMQVSVATKEIASSLDVRVVRSCGTSPSAPFSAPVVTDRFPPPAHLPES